LDRSIIRRCSGGKLVKVTVKAVGGTIEGVCITGDFFIHPEGRIEILEGRLAGIMAGQVEEAVLKGLGEDTLIIGFNPEELIIMIEECLK